jgi:hypothetical protein
MTSTDLIISMDEEYEKDNDDNDSEDGAERLCGVYDVPRRAEGEGGYWMVL